MIKFLVIYFFTPPSPATSQALNSIKFSSQAADEQARQRKVSRTDDDIGRNSSGRTWRRGSLDGGFASSSSSSFEGRRRSSCGFKDPMLSRFAEELMKADTSVPELVIVGSHPSSTSTGELWRLHSVWSCLICNLKYFVTVRKKIY